MFARVGMMLLFYGTQAIGAERAAEVARQKLIVGYTNKMHAQNNEECYRMLVSPDETRVWSVGQDYRNHYHYVRLHNAENGFPGRILGDHFINLKDPIWSASWSPDSAYVAYTYGTSAGIHQIKSPSLMRFVPTSCYQESRYCYALTGMCNQGPAHITASHRDDLSEFTSAPESLGSTLSSHSAMPTQSCFLENATSKCVYAPALHTAFIRRTDLAHDKKPITYRYISQVNLSGKAPLLGGENGKCCILDTQTGDIMTTLQAFDNVAISSLAASAQTLAAASDFDIALVSRETGTRYALFQHEGPNKPMNLCFDPQGKTVIYSAGRYLHMYAVANATPLQKIRLDDAPHTMTWGTTGLFVGTPRSITKYVYKKNKSRKRKQNKQEIT